MSIDRPARKALKILCVVGARPNFVKIAPIVDALRRRAEFEVFLTHTGQHYDDAMSGVFFRELGIAPPDVNLGVGSGSHATQTAELMKAFEPICLRERPDATLVVGDVNSALACALVSAKLGTPVAHVEAGLRSFDRRMPEELNRIVVDSIADLLFCTEHAAVENLRREGVAQEKIFFVGNVMIDTLLKNRKRAEDSPILETLGLRSKKYALATLHRPGGVDDRQTLKGILDAFAVVQRDLPLVLPLHPRTRMNLERFDLRRFCDELPNLKLIEPLGYFDFLKLHARARVLFTDSGGLQEEATVLKTPCVTIRENTERPVTCEIGSNQLSGLATSGILRAYERVKRGDFDNCGTPELWDGRAAERIADVLAKRLVILPATREV